MLLAKVTVPAEGSQTYAAVVDGNSVRLLPNGVTLTDLLHHETPRRAAESFLGTARTVTASHVRFLAPIDSQEVWAAGVTYKRSQIARMEESESGASHYDKVYTAPRPEIFFKATPHRVAGPGEPVRVRYDSHWSVPEPEFTLVLNPQLKIVGYTIGNDMSARDIEGENPLYLPQAKVYRQCCALGPVIRLADEPLDPAATTIKLSITRGGFHVFSGETNLAQLHRTFPELADWLGREDEFPQGAFLLTGTGVVPNDEVTLEHGDEIAIEVAGIGILTNPVVKDSR